MNVEGIAEKRIEMIVEGWEEQKDIKHIMIFLQEHGVSTAYSAKIYKQYGPKSIEILKDNPPTGWPPRSAVSALLLPIGLHKN